jgi:hypothetical protein
VPSAVFCKALQDDEADGSLGVVTSEFFTSGCLASAGAVGEARAATMLAKIASLIRMGGSPFSKRQ